MSTCQTNCQCSIQGCQTCQTTCQFQCQDTCELTCQAACQSACQTACESSCQITCEIHGQVPIEKILFYEDPITVIGKKTSNPNSYMDLGAYSDQEGPSYKPTDDFVDLYNDSNDVRLHTPIKNFTIALTGKTGTYARPSRSLYGWRNMDTSDGIRYYGPSGTRTDYAKWHNGVDLYCIEGTEIYAIDDCVSYKQSILDTSTGKYIYAVNTVFLDQEKYGMSELVNDLGVPYSEVKGDSVKTSNWVNNLKLDVDEITKSVNKKYAYAAYLHVMDNHRPIDGSYFIHGAPIKEEGYSGGISSNSGMDDGKGYHLHFELYIPRSDYSLKYDARLEEANVRMSRMKFGSVNPSRYFLEF